MKPAHLERGTRVVESLEYLLHGVLCILESHINIHTHESLRFGKQCLQCTSFLILVDNLSAILCSGIFGTAHNDSLHPALANDL